jgi:hypothetical protein
MRRKLPFVTARLYGKDAPKATLVETFGANKIQSCSGNASLNSIAAGLPRVVGRSVEFLFSRGYDRAEQPIGLAVRTGCKIKRVGIRVFSTA